MARAPDVVHLGFSKCASTFLQAFFDQHPEIYLVLKSHYFTPFEHCDFDRPVEDYERLFSEAQPNQVRLESDEHIILPEHHPVLESAATTLESVSELCRRIKTVRNDARVMLVVRNQVALIASRYSEYLLAGGRLDFEDFVGEFLSCSSDGRNYLQNYYAQILEILRNEFGAENVLFILQEDFRRDESATITQICKFFGIEALDTTVDTARSRRAGLSIAGMKMVRAFNRMIVRRPAKSYRNADVHGPYVFYKAGQIAMRIIDYYLPKSFKGDKKELLSPEIVQRIRDEFADDNHRLGEMLGRDLSSLGY